MGEISLSRFKKYLIWAIFSILLLTIAYFLSDIFIILILSLLLSMIFEPFVKLIENKGLNRLPSTILVFVLAGLFIYLIFSYIIPQLSNQINQLIEILKDFSLHNQIVTIEREIHKYLPFFKVGTLAKNVEGAISAYIVNSFNEFSSVLSGIVSVVAILVIVPFITFFLLKDSRKIFRGILNVMPNKYFEMSYWIIRKISFSMGRFVRAWIFDASFVGFCCGIGFYLIGIENALILGVIAGLGHLVPYFGPVIGGIPAAIISIIQYGDLSKLPPLAIVIFTIYAIDNGFVQPYVFSKSVEMHPIVIILLIIAGGQLMGVMGMLLAIPTATVIKTAAKESYYAFKNYKIARL
ncbi:MAG: AI-2E family transporter [Ignavibacteriaceae bacterium]|nr:AI-2E family transporter [Ignavibacteriaceae bacterium]